MSRSDIVYEGSLVENNPVPSCDWVEKALSSEDILKRGLLFVGGAGQGKTNVLKKVATDVILNAKPSDVIVFLDIKGDYYDTFYRRGDICLSPKDDRFLWNIFQDFRGQPFGRDLQNRIQETVEYLFFGMTSEKEPFWTNGAKMILFCLISHMLLEAAVWDDDSGLNHVELAKLIDGELSEWTDGKDCSEAVDLSDRYENYRRILNSNKRFQAAGMMIPPKEVGTAMGYGVITELLAMKSRILRGNFCSKMERPEQCYISPATISQIFPERRRAQVLFLRYNLAFQDSCATVFRCFVDQLIVSYFGHVRRSALSDFG